MNTFAYIKTVLEWSLEVIGLDSPAKASQQLSSKGALHFPS